MAAKKKNPSFEDELARLEEIAGKMESGDLSLEELMALHEEGMRLSDALKKRLDQAGDALKVVYAGEDGRPVLTDSDIVPEKGQADE